MTFNFLVILSLIFPLSSICNAQASSVYHQHQVDSTYLVHDGSENGVTENFRPGKGQNLLHRRHRFMSNAHGVLNIMGWGTLLPIGVIISRYFRKFPLKSDEWLPLHVLCQTSGYIVGTIGWGIGLWLGNSSKHYNTLKTHRILGILVFTFATVQMLTTTILLQARREDEWRKCWEIYHHVLGYAVIGLSAAEIFQGIMHQSHAGKWRLAYVGILAVLVFVAFALEIVRWIIKSRIQQHLSFDNNLYNYT